MIPKKDLVLHSKQKKKSLTKTKGPLKKQRKSTNNWLDNMKNLTII